MVRPVVGGWRRWLPYAVAMSFLAHAAVAWLLLPHRAMRASMAEQPPIEVELVDQAPQMKGTPADAPTAPQPSPEMPPETPPETPPLRTADTGEAPPPPPPAAPSRLAPPGRGAAVNLGGADEDLEGLTVTGRNVVPPRPDATVRNKPPSYPADAARRRAEGVVGLLVHVAENGVPLAVEVVGSSGDASLDRSAREAVALWRFQPARSGGAAVPFDYEMNISFRMGDR